MFGSCLLSGTCEVSLDDKGRLPIPARYRQLIKDDGGRCYVTRSLRSRCLWLYPAAQWEKVVEVLGRLPTLADAVCQAVQRTVLGSAGECSLDGQGRILLPAELRRFASLERKALLIGMNNKFELWSEQNIEEQRRSDEELLSAPDLDFAAHQGLEGLRL
ncbi:MAG: division/cell wall cluster transcriptional repressor MraZ [Succinivibrio sp.]|nr:division/cell wall cluster transcriptional repressor MraZ [Succinivibrio sp.]